MQTTEKKDPQQWDSSSDPGFFEYYEKQSQSKATYDRFVIVRDKVIKLYASLASGKKNSLDVADIGCGAGTQSLLWAQLGHRVSGIDINKPLVDLAKKRAAEAGFTIRFEVGSATELPLEDQSMDVCLLPELLEHVVDWQSCLKRLVGSYEMEESFISALPMCFAQNRKSSTCLFTAGIPAF